METTFDLQPLTEQDIPELIALHHSVGWHSAPDFLTLQMKLFLAVGKLFGHRDQDKLITCAGVYAYDTGLVSIGPVIVHPAYQRKGLGQLLMERCLQECLLPGTTGTTVMLIATEAGQRLYHQIGFETVGYIRRFVYDKSKGLAHEQKNADRNTPIRSSDLPRLIEADRLVFGADRSAFYKQHLAHITCGFLLNNNSVPKLAALPVDSFPSFGIATLRGDTLQIGPLIADDHEHALQLIHQFLHVWHGTLRIDVPSDQHRFIYTLQQLGFVETLTSPLMTLGGAKIPGRRESLYGIADPALG